MHASLFDLFKIGIGPSSSHTVAPIRAAYRFAERLANHEMLEKVAKVRIELFGALALTGLGHGTDRGVLLGLMGKQPDAIEPSEIKALIEGIRKSGLLTLFARLQGKRFDLRRRSRMPGRGRRRLLDGRRRPAVGSRRNQRTARACRGNRYGTEPRHDLRPSRRPRADSLHRTQAFGAVKAMNAARMAMKETTGHKVSLDQVIRTMYQTGLDMQTRYKETALGGLALNVIEC
jgi:Serine dehydratase beta chain/Serine dehydratase alpha chain